MRFFNGKPPHSGVSANDSANALAAAAHSDDEPSTFLKEFTEANMLMIHQSVTHRRPHSSVKGDCALPPEPKVPMLGVPARLCTTSELNGLLCGLFSSGLNMSVVAMVYCVVTRRY